MDEKTAYKHYQELRNHVEKYQEDEGGLDLLEGAEIISDWRDADKETDDNFFDAELHKIYGAGQNTSSDTVCTVKYKGVYANIIEHYGIAETGNPFGFIRNGLPVIARFNPESATHYNIIFREEKDIPEEITGKLKKRYNDFRKAEISDNNTLVILCDHSTDIPEKYKTKAYIYCGPYKDGYARISNYGYGMNIRETGKSLEEVTSGSTILIIKELEAAGFTIEGIELDEKSDDTELILIELEEDEDKRNNTEISREKITKEFGKSNSPLTIGQYIRFARKKGLIDSKEEEKLRKHFNHKAVTTLFNKIKKYCNI